MTSRPLTDVIVGINKFSNNLMARHVLLTLAAESGRTPATAVQGIEQIRRWLNRSGIEAGGLVMANGSGLSREARISANTSGFVTRTSSNGCVPLDVGAILIASIIVSTLSCDTVFAGSIFLVA